MKRGTIRIVKRAAATTAMSIGKGKNSAAAGAVHAEATLPFTGADETPGTLNVSFVTDPSGQVSAPKLELAATAAGPATGGFCDPICFTFGNPPRTRCFTQTGCGEHPGPASALDVPMVLEFDPKAHPGSMVKMNVKLWRHGDATATAQSSGMLDFANAPSDHE